MDKFRDCRDRARHNIRVADHMLTMTYPLVKDPKLLPAVLENIFLALTNAIGAVLYYERALKRIPPFHDTFESKFSMFRAKVVPRYKIEMGTVRYIVEVKEIIQDHKDASTEFARQGKYIIANETYHMRTLSDKELKKHLKKAKQIVHELLQLVSKNDAIIGRR